MDKIQITHLLRLQEASNQGKLVVFVGAGVSVNSGVPNWGNLIKSFKDELPGNIGTETDYLKVAQIYKNTRDKKDYFEKIRKVLREGTVAYNPIHNAILQLNPNHIITTNYDNLIEQAIRANYKQYDIIRKDSDLPDYRYPNKVVKMHGDFSTDNIVLAEEDYYNYGRNFQLIRSFVTSLFTTNVVLFVGFSFDDLNLKVILNEIKTILDKDMQRVYLMTDEHVDKEMHEYYEKKGINVVSITNPDEYISNYGIEIDQVEIKKLVSSKGLNLYKQLKIIQQIDTSIKDDLLNYLVKRLKEFEPELNVLGDGLRYLFPNKSYSHWIYTPSRLRLDSSYFKKLSQELKTLSGKKEFVRLHPHNDRLFLLQHAFVNQIYKIDDLQIITNSNYDKIRQSFDDVFPVDYYYDLNFIKLYDTLKELKVQGMAFNYKDLYVPYILCRLGRYYDAYVQYKELIPKFWEKKLYILYFICLYNLFSIRHSIDYESWNKLDIDSHNIVKEIEKFDLESILTKLPIKKDIKQALIDVLTLKFFSRKSNDADELSRQIHRQKKHADRGGVSINNNIYDLISKFIQTYNFCISNCIEFNNSYFYSLAKDTASGILVSHITKHNIIDGIHEATKIDYLEWTHVFILLFFIKTSELIELIDQYDVNEIKLNKDALDKLEEITDNLYKALYANGRFQKPPYRVDIISNVIGNIVLLLGLSSTKFKDEFAEKLYHIIHDLWCMELYFTVGKNLDLFMRKYQPSDDVAIDLLDDMIKVGRYDILGLARIITNQLRKKRLVFNRIQNAEVLFEGYDGQLGMIMYHVLPSNIQDEYLKYVQNNSKRLLIYLIILKNLNVGVDNIGVFESLIKKPSFTTGFKKEQLTGACWILAGFRKNPLYSNVHSIIDDFGTKHEQYKFYLDPIGYKDTGKIETLWLLRIEEPILKELIKNDNIKEKVKTSILSGKLDEREANMLIKIL